jgi:serine/threonine protein phosphatase PrpC
MGKPVPNAGIYRVNGNLALSRAIGDRSERPAVTSKPDVSTYRIEEGDEFIVLGSDGLWDVMSSQEVVTFVHTTQWGAAPAVVSGAFVLVVVCTFYLYDLML